ncbi:retrovirus-related pol polyprotein from transposon TNT 1-94 [Tanacetum coccineum]
MLARSMAAKLIAASASECLFANFFFEIEPKRVSKALKHPEWVDAMQKELNQFYRNKVWTLVPLAYGKEEGIDYDETFAPVARMESIRIFLAFATYMNFIVFQMDVKIAFLNGKLKEEFYVKQPSGFESSEFFDYVCKLDKAFYGLKQAPKAPKPPIDDSKARPLKEFIIKFTVKNGQRPLNLDYKTFCESTGLDYNNSQYVNHPFTKEDLGDFFRSGPRRELLTTEQLNSIQQFLVFTLLIRTKIDIGEIIVSDLITRLIAKTRQKYVSYPRFVSCALERLSGSNYSQDQKFRNLPNILSQSNFSKDPSKVTPFELTASMIEVINQEYSLTQLPFSEKKKKKRKAQTVTKPTPKSEGPEASGALPQKSKKSKTQSNSLV